MVGRRRLTLKLREKIAVVRASYKCVALDPGTDASCAGPNLLQATTEALEAVPGLLVDSIGDLRTRRLGVPHRCQLLDQQPRAQRRHLLTGSAPDRRVGGDEADALGVAVLGGEALEQVVGMGRVANLERAIVGALAGAVEDEHTSGAAKRDEARQRVAKLLDVGERTGVQDVETVEEVERRLRHRDSAVAPPRRGVPRPRR